MGKGNRRTSQDHAGMRGVQGPQLHHPREPAQRPRPPRDAEVLPQVQQAHRAPRDPLTLPMTGTQGGGPQAELGPTSRQGSTTRKQPTQSSVLSSSPILASVGLQHRRDALRRVRGPPSSALLATVCSVQGANTYTWAGCIEGQHLDRRADPRGPCPMACPMSARHAGRVSAGRRAAELLRGVPSR